MTDERLAKWEAGYFAIDRVLFSMAEELVGEQLAKTWQSYRYPDDYIDEKRVGKHARTFKGFLEGHSWQLRQKGYPCSAGDLQEIMDVYVACVGLGLSIEEMAFLSAKLLKQIRRGPFEWDKTVIDALAQKKLNGSYYLPSFDKPGVIKYTLETKQLADGRIVTVAFNSIRDGVAHRNYFADRGELHHFLLRTRAAHIEHPEEEHEAETNSGPA